MPPLLKFPCRVVLLQHGNLNFSADGLFSLAAVLERCVERFINSSTAVLERCVERFSRTAVLFIERRVERSRIYSKDVRRHVKQREMCAVNGV